MNVRRRKLEIVVRERRNDADESRVLRCSSPNLASHVHSALHRPAQNPRGYWGCKKKIPRSDYTCLERCRFKTSPKNARNLFLGSSCLYYMVPTFHSVSVSCDCGHISLALGSHTRSIAARLPAEVDRLFRKVRGVAISIAEIHPLTDSFNPDSDAASGCC